MSSGAAIAAHKMIGKTIRGKVAAEIQVCARELIGLILQMAERRESDAYRNSEDAVGNESQQVPGHR